MSLIGVDQRELSMVSPVKIMLVVHSLRRGGAERVLLELALGLIRRGHDVLVVSWLDVDEYTEQRYLPIKKHYLLAREMYKWPWGIREGAKSLRKIVEEFKPDALELHTPTVAWVTAWARLDVSVTHVIHGYSNMPTRVTGKSIIYRLIDVAARVSLRAKLVTVSGSMIPIAASHYLIAESKVTCVANGVDLLKYRCSIEKPSREIVILMLGTLSMNKGQHLGIHAMKRLVENVPTAKLRIVGDGACRSDLEKLAEECGIAANVEFLGRRSDVPELLTKSHVLWQLSDSEGMPMVVIEAMASGVPVVAFDVRGNCDAVVNEETGLLIPYGDCAKVAAKTRELLTDYHTYETLARKARDRAETIFSLDAMVDGHERVLTTNIYRRPSWD